MRPPRFAPRSSFALLVLALGLGACTDTVYRDRPPFNPPPDEASGFLGYYTASDRQTTCGNCHVGQQMDWIQTKHANAWADLQAHPDAEAFCESCHTVNSRGNQPLADVGYDNVVDEAYHDVQCESCHGPGLDHVENPSIDANRPLASANVYPSADVADTAALVNSSCGACHQGAGPSQNHDYLEEWRASRHGQLRFNQANNPSCQRCHEGKGALLTWGVNTTYQELGTDILLPQNCVVCHDPHGSAQGTDGQPLPGQLRFPITEPDVDRNLCTKCHNNRAEALPERRGGHGTQGPVLFGTAGYFPPGTVYDVTAILSTHGSAANPRLCAGCHVNSLSGVDEGGNPTSFTGHSFHPIPCLAQKAPPVVDPTYSNDCAYDEPSRSWASCTASGCHGSEAIAVQRLEQILAEKEGYIATLWVDLDADENLDPFPTDDGYLAHIMLNVPNDLDIVNEPYKSTLTPAKGALFNAKILGETLDGHPDGSHGVHNPFLYRALLQASIADLEANYGGILPAMSEPVLSRIQAAIRSGELRMAPRTEQAVMNARASTPAGGQAGSN
jgi:hypothetical protein